MPQFRPAGFSDSDSDSDDYGFYEKPARKYYPIQENAKKKIEVKLQDAIINGNVDEVADIISLDLNNGVNMKLDSGWTPLMHACFHAQDSIVELLLDKGADPNLHADSVTPVMAACSNSSANNETIYNIVTNLIKKDCILNVGDKHGQTPLMRAISSGRLAVVQKLIDMKVNIEMRDQQGWTALFWAVHHNQPGILELLIVQGARLNEVDKSGRKPLDIANSHDYENIVEILHKHMNIDDNADELDRNTFIDNQLSTWHEFYPGIKQGGKLSYTTEIPHLLYGMNCERLGPLFNKSGIGLRTFLLLEEGDMIKMGIDMPYERQRLIHGLRNFHLRGWKLNAVAGLYARKAENFSVLDCLTSLGNHLHQLYVLEATLQYTLREFDRVQNQMKFEPPDSPLLTKMTMAAKKTVTNINCMRTEMKSMKRILVKINRNNPQPADLIKEKSTHEIVLGYISEVLMICSLGLLVYNAKNFITNLLKK